MAHEIPQENLGRIKFSNSLLAASACFEASGKAPARMLKHGLLRMLELIGLQPYLSIASSYTGGHVKQPLVLASSLIMCVAVVQSTPALAQLRPAAVHGGPPSQYIRQQSPPPSSGQSGSTGSGGTYGGGTSGTSGTSPYYATQGDERGGSGAGGSTASSQDENYPKKTQAELLQAQTEALNSLAQKIKELEVRLNKLEKKRR